jgi:hypothetical protein
MSARYLIRLDDACDTMDRRKWGLLEEVLDRHAIRPIVAVVPDNQDPALVFNSRDDAFWEKVRGWQAKGWTLAMHGHTHVMQPTRRALLVPFYQRSEFAGLELEAQRAKRRAAVLTLRALREETSIIVVSDGIALDTYFEHDFYWIPQQMWRMARRRSGLWTVCLHPNEMSEAAIAALDEVIGTGFRGQIIGSAGVRLRKRRKSLLGWAYHQYFWWRWRHRKLD